MESGSVPQIRIMSMMHLKDRELALVSRKSYNPVLCKTCQKIGLPHPRVARVKYSDCEEHFQKRVMRLFNTGVSVLSKTGGFKEMLSL